MVFDSLWLRVLVAALVVLGAQQVEAQPTEAPQNATQNDAALDEAVADALLARAKELVARRDYHGAKMLVVESLQRSDQGPGAADALALLKSVNRTLGLSDLDRTIPGTAAPAAPGEPREPYEAPPMGEAQGDGPLDPYDSSPAGTAEVGGVVGGGKPLDPYGELMPGTGAAEPLDPYGDGARPVEEIEPGGDPKARDAREARRTLLVYSGLYGFTAGMALAGPNNEFGELADGATVVGILGAATGVGVAHLVSKKYSITASQAGIIGWSGIWGGATVGFLADMVTGIDTSTTNDIYKGVALGGLLGTGAGMVLSRKIAPSVGDIALANSLGLYGAMSGVLLGLAMEPTQSEAYSLNALLGTAVGLGTGIYAARRLDTTRRRMFWVDMGAAAGSLAPWLLLYPLMGEDSDSAAQVTGVVSNLGLIGGALIAWRLSAGMDKEARVGRMQIARAPVPGLFQRSEDGQWSAGMLSLRPLRSSGVGSVVDSRMQTGSGARPVTGRGVLVDLFGGRF